MRDENRIAMETQEGLRRLKEATKGAEAPERVEEALLAAFRKIDWRTDRFSGRPRWLSWALAGAGAAALGVLAGFWVLTRPPVETPPAAVRVPPAPRSDPQENHESTASASQRGVERLFRRPRPAPEAEPATELATEFIAVTDPATWPEGLGGQVWRVRLPRSSLAMFGLPMNAERASEPVQADLMVGQDGMVRAIRFVQ